MLGFHCIVLQLLILKHASVAGWYVWCVFCFLFYFLFIIIRGAERQRCEVAGLGMRLA